MAVVNELVTKFTFEGSLAPLGNFQKGLQDSIILIGKYGAVFAAATTATALWANSVLHGAESMVRLSQDTGISINKLQKYQYIVARSGVASEDFESSILSLSDKIGEAATQGNEDFNRLGISVRDAFGNVKSADVVLGELAGTFKGLSQEQQLNFAQKLGIDNNIIGALSQSNVELNKLAATAEKFGLVTEDQTKQLDKYFASIESLKFGFTAVSRQMALQFAPILEKVSNNVVDFLADFGSTYGVVFAEFFDGIGNLIGAFNTLVKATVGWTPLLIAFGAAMLIAFPVVAIVAAVGLLFVAVEDLITAFAGGKSVIADFFKDTFDIDIVKTMTTAIDGLTTAMDTLGISGRDLFNALSPFAGLLSDIERFLPTAPQPLSATKGNTQTTQVVTNDIKIEVKTNDPEAAGRAVSTSLAREIEQANFQSGKGGR